MMCSVDGRTLTKNGGKLKGVKLTRKFTIPTTAMPVCGRVTMERDFASTGPVTLTPSTAEIPK